jgi:phage terminase large subunit
VERGYPSHPIKKDSDAKYWIEDEWYHTGKTDAQIADYVVALKWNECYPDPESASGCEELRRRGVNVRDAIKNKDSVRNGINSVRELFKSNRLCIHASCKNLIWELETYSYPEKKQALNEEENPIKENDHTCGALCPVDGTCDATRRRERAPPRLHRIQR